MKKQGVINSQIAAVVAQMGHGDSICIADAGLPIPEETKRIDLAVTPGIPSFLTVVDNILTELAVEEVAIAKETTDNSDLYGELLSRFKKESIDLVTHEEFKKQLSQVKAVIRSGEFTPYANIILRSGVTF